MAKGELDKAINDYTEAISLTRSLHLRIANAGEQSSPRAT